MSSEYHKNVIKLLVDYGGTLNKVIRVKTSGYISLNHPYKLRKIIAYNPDVRYVLRKGVIIFEVIETQNKDKTISDVIRAFLAPNVSQVYFIVKTKSKNKEAFEVIDVLLTLLSDKFGIKKKELPLDVKIIPIEEREINDREKVFKKFSKRIIF